MEYEKIRDAVDASWEQSVVPSLSELVRIPALSAEFDPAWREHGGLRAAVDHVRGWIEARGLPGTRCEVLELDGRAPLLVVDVPATPGAEDAGTVLLYGHLDKQPPFDGWSEGLDAWRPVLRDGRLYGRGAVDDGYSGYAAVAALEAVHAGGGGHARAVVLLETGEESGSPDLPAYIEHLAGRLGDVTLVVCLDAGGGDYERLWLTASLRGVVQATVTVRILETALHSGIASGIVPSSFRVMRLLLDRLENPATGRILVPEMNVEIPEERLADARAVAALDPGAPGRAWPLVPGARPVSEDDVELILNNTWRPTLSVIGAAGLPDVGEAGNVLRTSTTLRLSFRLPPTADAAAAAAALERLVTADAPYGARVEVTDLVAMNGWSAPPLSPWLAEALDGVGEHVFADRHRSIGIGGAIPFMELLGRRYPRADFVVTGALGSDSNMHVADEWLNLRFARQVTEAVAHVLDAHARRAG